MAGTILAGVPWVDNCTLTCITKASVVGDRSCRRRRVPSGIASCAPGSAGAVHGFGSICRPASWCRVACSHRPAVIFLSDIWSAEMSQALRECFDLFLPRTGAMTPWPWSGCWRSQRGGDFFEPLIERARSMASGAQRSSGAEAPPSERREDAMIRE